jgi:iron complex outermembrane recepter protein
MKRRAQDSQSCPVQVSLLALALGAAFPSFGQSPTPAAEAPAPAIETIVIKARGRDETQQTVPLSVKAFSAKSIEDAGIKAVGDFVALTANLSLTEAQSVGTSFMTIRGLSQVRNGEPPMAVVVDGVIQSDAKQFGQELFDIQSIEVLRGPQGALYGRNAAGGAILITTKQPSDKTGGYVQLGIGDGGHKQVQSSVGGAIVPGKLLFRLSGSHTDRDGYFTNDNLNKKVDPYRDTTLRGLLKWRATDDLDLDLRLNSVRDKSGALNYQYQPTRLNPDCTADLANVFDFSRVDADSVTRRFCANNLGFNTRDLHEVTAKFDYNLSFATLTGIASFNRITEKTASDQFPYTASRNVFGFADGTTGQFVDAKTQSYELRLTSPSQRGVRWMAGVYALKTERFSSTFTGQDLGLGLDPLERDPGFSSAISPTLSWFADDNNNRASAVFGNVDWDITPRVELSTAIRYDRDEREQRVDPRQASAPGVPAGLPSPACATTPAACLKKMSFSAVQPKVSLRYKFEQSGLGYVSWGKGFRSGQFNQSGVGAAAATAGVTGVSDEIGAEKTTTAELGYKTELLGGKLRLNTALFDTKVTNAPYFVFVGAVSAQVLVGIDEVSLRGGEFEAVASLAPGLDGSFGVGYTNSKIKAYNVNPSLVGNQAPYVPKITANLGLQYRFPVGAGMRMLLRGDLVSKGKQYWDPENSTARSTVNLLNLRVALEDAAGKWNLALAAQNVTDEIYNAEFVSGGFVQPGAPRSVRLDLRYNF